LLAQPTFGSIRWIGPALLASCFCMDFLGARAFAQDAALASPQLDSFLYAPVVAKSPDVWMTVQPDRLSGTIEELDDQRIVFVSGAQRRELPSHRVMHVEPVWRTPAAVEAHRLFSERRYREAKEAISGAVTNDLPRWQQRLLVAEIVDVLAALGDPRLAGGVYLASLAPNHPPAMLYSQLPINWTTAEPDRALYESAVQWLESDDEHAQLLGASWLLLGADREAARAKLLKLQKSKLEPIAAIAAAQAWRLVPPPETESKMSEWFEFRDRCIPPLQLGPTEFLADRLGRTGSIDLAIGQWSRIATLHADRPHRAAAALAAAQRLLLQQGRPEEAARFGVWLEKFQSP